MARRPSRARSSLIFAVLAVGVASADEHWPRFHGNEGGVAADDARLPDVWNASTNVVWRLDVPGWSWSSPVIWAGHVFVTTAVNTADANPAQPASAYTARTGSGKPLTFQDISSSAAEHRWVLYDIDAATGRIRWEREVARAAPGRPRHLKNSYASETPVTDGERVYVYIGHLGLFAFDFSGSLLWSKPMPALRMLTDFGTAKSPVVDEERVYIVSDNEEQSFIAAYDKKTGTELWREQRKETSNWTTPLVWKNGRRTEIVTAGTGGVRSYGTDGRLLWQLSGMSRWAVPSPIAAGGLLYVTSGYTGDPLRPVYAIRPGASGDISLAKNETSSEHIAWFQPTAGPFHPSPIVYRGCYYTLHDRGFLTCHDPATGREIYGRQRLSTDVAAFTASPWAYNGKVFALTEDGDTYVIQAGPEFKVLGRNSLGQMSLATPAVANGSLFIRTVSTLYRISAAG